MRLIQHKKEAYWFYRFLSVFYDRYVNPLFWTEYMRDESLKLAHFDHHDLEVIDVGSGTGFTTQGIVQHVKADHVTCLDQSPHQMKKAKQKNDLLHCRFILGDAENIPFPANTFDRYVSAGSIEYWPDPQQGINESFRVIKPGGIALMIGPLEPGNKMGRFIAKTWMLFPALQQYQQWYQQAGFTNIETKFIRPQWFRGKYEYGVAIAGKKPLDVPQQLSPVKAEPEKMSFGRKLKLFFRVMIGSLAGFLFIPVALFGYFLSMFRKKDTLPGNYRERLNGYQVAALLLIVSVIVLIIILIVGR